MTDTNQLPEPELGYIHTDKSNQPAFSARQMREAMQARAQVQGELEPVAWCIEAQIDGEWFVQYPIAFTKQGAELDASHYQPGEVLRIRPLTFGDTTPQPAQATQAEVTDEQIIAAYLAWCKTNGTPESFARAILALHPERVPMTDDGVDAKCLTIIGHLLSRKERDRIVWRMAEAHHGITAQAKKETP